MKEVVISPSVQKCPMKVYCVFTELFSCISDFKDHGHKRAFQCLFEIMETPVGN